MKETTAVSPGQPFSPAASAVLDVIVKAEVNTGKPIPHPQIVKAMAGRDYSKKEAYAGIAYCQKRGWIKHDMVSGYTLG